MNEDEDEGKKIRSPPLPPPSPMIDKSSLLQSHNIKGTQTNRHSHTKSHLYWLSSNVCITHCEPNGERDGGGWWAIVEKLCTELDEEDKEVADGSGEGG